MFLRWEDLEHREMLMEGAIKGRRSKSKRQNIKGPRKKEGSGIQSKSREFDGNTFICPIVCF